jgi:hypothetical protein
MIDRLAGLRAGDGEGLLVRSRSVHALWSAATIGVVALDRAGRVLVAKPLRPGHVVTVPGAAWMAEIGSGGSVPKPGTAVVPMLLRCRDG